MTSKRIRNNRVMIALALLFAAAGALTAQSAELKINSGHSAEIHKVCFSPDDRYIASVSDDKTVKLWDVASGKEIKTFRNQSLEDAEYGWAFSKTVLFTPDGKSLVCGGAGGAMISDITGDKDTKFWDQYVHCIDVRSDGTMLVNASEDKKYGVAIIPPQKDAKGFSLLGHDDDVLCAVFSTDGKYVASGSRDKTIILWNVETGKKEKVFHGHKDYVNAVAFSPDGKDIASGGGTDDPTVRLWNAKNGRAEWKAEGHTNAIEAVCFSPDGKYVVSGSFDGTIKFWDRQTGKEAKTYKHNNEDAGTPVCYSIGFSHSGKYLAAGYDDKTLGIWDVESNAEIASFPGKRIEMRQAIFSADGMEILSFDSDRYVKSWALDSRIGSRTLLQHTGYNTDTSYYRALCFSKDCRNVACSTYSTGSGISDIALYDLTNKKKKMTLSGHDANVDCADFSPDGKYLASGSKDKTVRLWNLETGKQERVFHGHKDSVNAVAFSSDGKYIASGSGGSDLTVRVWNAEKGKEEWSAKEDSISIESVCFSPDGRYVAIGGYDGTIRLRDARTGNEYSSFKSEKKARISSVAFSADGRFLLSSHHIDEFSLKLWDVSTGKLIRTFEGHTGDVKSARFSPDGKHIVSASSDGSVRIWDAASGVCLVTRYDVPDSNDWVAVTPDGRFDGTEAGLKLLYYVKGMDIIPLESFYERFFTPGLIAQVLGGNETGAQVAVSASMKLPPKVRIVSPLPDTSSTEDSVTVTVEATDQGGGIDEILLYQNGKLVETTQRGLKVERASSAKQTQSFTVALLPGANVFKATAFNSERTESIPGTITVTYTGVQKTTTLHLFVIGINTYKNATYDLNYAYPDAQSIKQKILEVGHDVYKDIKVYELYNENATKSAILSVVAQIEAAAGPNDLFLFYYAGHGVMSEPEGNEPGKYYIVPFDLTKMYGDNDLLEKSGISAQTMRDWCKNIKAQKQVLLLDACQSGGAVATFAMRGASEEKAVMQLGRSAGVVVLAGTGTKQFASEFAQLKHGVFTYAILEGLSGKADGGNHDKKITIKELESFVEDYIPELSRQYRGESQYPNSYSAGMDFPIGIAK